MNTEIIVHPKLHHYGLITGNLDAMVDWYRKVLGMTINHLKYPELPPTLSDAATPGCSTPLSSTPHWTLLGTYARLKSLSVLPVWAADHGVGTSFLTVSPTNAATK